MNKSIQKKVWWNDTQLEVTILPNNTNIKDSYLVKSREDMKNILTQISLPNFSNYACDKRTIKSMIQEWCVHNLLYNLGVFKKKTKDVDFEYPQKWYVKIGYIILAPLYRN